MKAKLKNLAVRLTLNAILLSLTFANMKIAYSTSNGGKIDLFTQKEPYSGKGLNTPSDAFGPEEVVILYALVTYNEIPVPDLLVAFDVNIPSNKSFCLTSRTNSSGIATVNFTLLTPPISINESEVFGIWLALANVLIGNVVFQDTLTFKVEWIVKLISVRTIDENLTYRTEFGKTGDVGLEITLRSIAMSIKSTTLAIVIKDELNVPVNFSAIPDFEVQSNEKLVFLYCKLHVPKWAYVGKATVLVSALTAPVNQSGVAYCPAISTNFFITRYGPFAIAFHDVAVVNVVPSDTSVELGQPLSISVVVRNEGTEVESFNVSAYCGRVLIGTLDVIALLPYSKVTLNFTLDTSLFDVGNYTITVSIPCILNEADLTDNVFVDGVVEIKPKLPTIIHDIAIVDVKISNSSLYIGDLLLINVSVANKGTETETFSVETYYDFSLIGTLKVNDLAPNTQVALIFVWNTSSICEGFYQINAFAPLPGDINVSDNTFIDGVVQVKAKPPPPAKQYYLTVRTDPPGVVSIFGEGWYYEDTNVNLPAPEYVSVLVGVRYRFSYWDVDGASKASNSIIVTMDASHTATAHYILQHYLTVRTDPPEIATIVGEGWYDESSNVTLDAPAVSDYNFGYWDVNGVSRGSGVNAITVHMDAPQTATAHYAQIITYTLTITTTEGGTTDPEPGTYNYIAGSTVQVTAISNANYVFDHWELDNVEIGSVNPYTVTMDKNYTLKAVFSQAPSAWFVSEWFYWLLLILLILIIFLLIVWLYRRKRRKEAEEAFYTGWTAWYYCYDLRSKTRKI
jgi:hypothetical protein